MSKIYGKIRNIIYSNDNGYVVALFRVKKVEGNDMEDFLNKTITITGNIININFENKYILTGKYVEHYRYGFQFQVDDYEVESITDEDSLIEFLSSSLVKGCGEKTAKLIVDNLGINALDIIKKDPEKLYEIKGIPYNKANKIYLSICSYKSADEMLLYLKGLGFNINECSLIYSKYGEGSKEVIEHNYYALVNLISFNRLDHIYVGNFNPKSDERINACILETVKQLDFKTGDVCHEKNEIYQDFLRRFMFDLELEIFDKHLEYLVKNKDVVKEKSLYYYHESYEDELLISDSLKEILNNGINNNLTYSKIFRDIGENAITYNDEQKEAIVASLNNSITIISGGPGVGKTTIIKAIVNAYMSQNKLSKIEALQKIALLAPTGRAAKKLASSTELPAQTIHRFLKWNKELDNFQVNEYNKDFHNLIIIDESSMLDNHLFASLLRGLTTKIKLILVGDVFQLPSVGPGQILSDLINSNVIPFVFLKQIYRQSSNSYIPYLARDIKEKDLSLNYFNKKDDYTFIEVDKHNIKSMIKKICEISKTKGIKENDIQILAPMYKGENGIDNLNYMLQNFFNPKDDKKQEIVYGNVIYREHDKVLQQVNNPDCNVFNGDIGYIMKIDKVKDKSSDRPKDVITINFDDNYVEYTRDDLSMVTHAYAITVHKSQGSEFPHVIIPVCSSYNKMLYNKLIYTAVSRAKKSLVILGEKDSFINSISNDYSTNRKTGLKEKLMNNK